MMGKAVGSNGDPLEYYSDDADITNFLKKDNALINAEVYLICGSDIFVQMQAMG